MNSCNSSRAQVSWRFWATRLSRVSSDCSSASLDPKLRSWHKNTRLTPTMMYVTHTLEILVVKDLLSR